MHFFPLCCIAFRLRLGQKVTENDCPILLNLYRVLYGMFIFHCSLLLYIIYIATQGMLHNEFNCLVFGFLRSFFLLLKMCLHWRHLTFVAATASCRSIFNIRFFLLKKTTYFTMPNVYSNVYSKTTLNKMAFAIFFCLSIQFASFRDKNRKKCPNYDNML